MSQSTSSSHASYPLASKASISYILDDPLPPPASKSSILYIMNPPRSAATSQWDDSNAARLLSQINKVRTHPAANPARPWYRGQIPDVPLWRKQRTQWMTNRRNNDWGSDPSNPLHKLRDRLETAREILPEDSYWRDQQFILALSTFSYHCWSSPYTFFSRVRNDIKIVAEELEEDLELALRAGQGKQSLRASRASQWIGRGGATFDLDSVRDHLVYIADEHTKKVEEWRGKTGQQRERLAPLSNKKAEGVQKAWDKIVVKRDANIGVDESLDAQIEALDKDDQLQRVLDRGTFGNPTEEPPRSRTVNACLSQSAPGARNQRRNPSQPKGKSSSTDPKRVQKQQNKYGAPPSLVGLSHSAPPPQSFTPPSLFAPAAPLNAEPWKLSTPEWAGKYKKGMLAHLGLVRWRYGMQGNDVITPPNKLPRPIDGAGDPNRGEAFSWKWGLYMILARMPGGKARLNPLFRMCIEWCPDLEPALDSSCRHSLSTNSDYFFSENSWWRLSDIGERRIKKPGPQKGVSPREYWKTMKNSTKSSETGSTETKPRKAKRKQVKTAASEELSTHEPVYGMNSGHPPEGQAPVFNSCRIDATYPNGQDAEGPEGFLPVHPIRADPVFSQPSTAGSSQPPPPYDRGRPISEPALERQFIAIDRPLSIPRVERKPLPAGPAKRKREDENSALAKKPKHSS